jgi:hypothetical protein
MRQPQVVSSILEKSRSARRIKMAGELHHPARTLARANHLPKRSALNRRR